MKSLAQFIVGSTTAAIVVVALATATQLLAWVGAAALALFTLRFGLLAAAPVLLAGVVPAAFWAAHGEIGPLLTVLGAALLAQYLRIRASWAELLTVLPFCMGGLCAMVLVLAPDYVASLQEVLAGFIEQFRTQLQQGNPSDEALQEALQAMQVPTGPQLMGMLALLQSATVLASLLLGRWWQAVLFNPGGFRSEFHALRLERTQVLLLVAVLVGLFSTGGGEAGYSVWAWVFALPIIVAGIAMVHGLAGIANGASRWLWLFYVVLFLVRPVVGILVALAVMDSALDFRSRLRQMLANRAN